MNGPRSIHNALLLRREILDHLRKLAGALPPAPAATGLLQAIGEHRDLAVGVCMNELSSPSTQLRHAVAAVLRKLEAVEVESELEELSEDAKLPEENRAIARDLFRELRPKAPRSSLAFPLPRVERPESGKALLDTLGDDPSTRSSFLQAFTSAPPDIRVTTLEGLGALKDPRAIPVYQAASTDRDTRVAEAAMRGLAGCPDPAAREALEELASGAHGPAVRRLAARFLMGLRPDPPEARSRATQCVAGPVDLRGERDLLMAAPRSGGTRWDLLRARVGIRGGILSIEARPSITAPAASSAIARLASDGGFLTSGPAYVRVLLEDALAAPEAGPNRLGPWTSLLGSKPLSPRPYRPGEEIAEDEAKSNLKVAERLLQRPEFRGWFVADPMLDHLGELAATGDRSHEELLDRFVEEFLEPQRWILVRSLELTRDMLLRRGDRQFARAVAATEWAFRDPSPASLRRDPLLLALLKRRLATERSQPASRV